MWFTVEKEQRRPTREILCDLHQIGSLLTKIPECMLKNILLSSFTFFVYVIAYATCKIICFIFVSEENAIYAYLPTLILSHTFSEGIGLKL